MRFLLLFLFASLPPLARKPPLTPFHIRGFAQGTSYQITYYAEDSLISKAQVAYIFAQLDSSLSLYKPYSLISQFNRSENGLPVDRHLSKVVRKAQQVSEKTVGTFDITVAPLVQAWGFGASPPATGLPDSVAIKALLACVGTDKIRLRHGYLHKDKPCVRIDVNGIAQGYTVDVLAGLLEQRGIQNYLVEVGGEVRVKGTKQPGGQPMAIGIEGPASGSPDDPYPIRKIIRLSKGAVTTSGNYRKFYQSGNQRISHLIDPKTGYPLKNELISVTVWAKDAMTADAYDNALMGMGLEKALRFASRQHSLEAYFIYQTPNGSVADTATSGFYRLMQ
ncbi:FAD:protein FMN transferase [Pontibacter sp. E15-1]|uniref:FAD:protein FMN transferase n=1 Tax=Pontibacter sp. E15-1 TaxID=2919918 RepID=UPI001F4F6FC3|nr:FAD:protein FMN transferase [Pontibacter sp. E15-1]MCJ8167187.1 FAD:protein FMN transferase [Pontibacter sp. E15-1]